MSGCLIRLYIGLCCCVFLINAAEIAPLTFVSVFFFFWWTGVDNFYDGIEDMIGYRPNSWMKWSWTIITPVLCMVRDGLLFFFYFFIANGHGRQTRRYHQGPGFIARTKSATCLFSRAVLSSLLWNTSPWPITRCTSTRTGPSVWAGAWHCPLWSASPWWWSSRSCSLRDHWSRWATSPGRVYTIFVFEPSRCVKRACAVV